MSKTPDESQLQSRLDNMVDSGRTRMAMVREMNRDAIRYAYGDQHAGKTRKKNWRYPVMNRVYADMLQEIAILSANNPRMEALPREDTDVAIAKACGQVLKGQWADELNMRTKVIAGLLDDHLHGMKIAKIFYEPKEHWDEDRAQQSGAGWQGKIQVNIIHPERCGWDPEVELAAEVPTKARWIWTERWVDKAWAAQRWPEYKKHLIDLGEMDEHGNLLHPQEEGSIGNTEGSGTTDESGFNRNTNAWQGRERYDETPEQEEARLQSRLADLILGESRTGDGIGQPPSSSLVRLQEIYFKDYETETVEAEMADWPQDRIGEGAADHLFRQENDPLIYNRNRVIETDTGEELYEPYNSEKDSWPQYTVRDAYEKPKYPHGRLILRIGEDKPLLVVDEAWQYDRWPFAISPNSILPHLSMGLNCVELSRGFQDWMNVIASHMLNYVQFFSDPIIEVEEGTILKQKGKKKATIPNWAGAVVRYAKGAIAGNRVRRTEPPSMPPTLFQYLELFKQGDQDLKGVHDIAQGRASKGKQTLGELDMLNRNTRQRIAMQGALLDVWLKQIAQWIVTLMQDHFEPGEWVKYTGDDKESQQATLRWTQEMADAKYDISLEPVSTLPYDEEREIAKYVSAYQIVGPAMLEEVLKKMQIQNIPDILGKHQIVGPLTKLLELAQQAGMGPEQLMAAIQAQLSMLSEVAGEGPPPTNQLGVKRNE